MILVYIDESGDTGHNLVDVQQPVFVLGALLVPQGKWKNLEREFKKITSQFFGDEQDSNFELHAMDLVNRKGCFKGKTLEQTKQFRDCCLGLLLNLELKVVYRSIEKKKFNKYCENKYGPGISVAPYLMALPFVCTSVNEILDTENDLGMLIFDEHHSLMEIEKSLRTLRLDSTSTVTTEKLIEQGFFVDSSKSEAIQLIDLVLYYVRKFEESKLGYKVSSHHKETFPLIEKICESLRVHGRSGDILNWVESNVVDKTKKRLPPEDGAV